MKKQLAAICLIIITLTLSTSSYGAGVSGKKTRLDKGWFYLQGDLGNVWEAVRPKPKEDVPIWSEVTLPHCFNSYDAVSPDRNYYQGAGWYKTLLSPNNPYDGGRTIIEFEGAGQKTDVYIYTTKVGSHTGGYDKWSIDITDALAEFASHAPMERFDGKVPLTIRCDNSRDTEMIPSDLSDFNLYGGIYRNLNLVYSPSVSIKDVAIRTNVNPKSGAATIHINTELYAPTSEQKVELTLTVTDPYGKIIATKQHSSDGAGTEILLLEEELKKPILWSTDSPLLYTCTVSVNSDCTVTERFGFRHYEFTEHGPFTLNGKRLLIRGTHRHEDHAGVAAALTDDMMRREMLMIKQMGANFIRLGHYQQADLILDLCDSLGIMVWEEIPWCRGGLGGEKYQEQARRMLRNMITQHRNHPSVILWGMGNENDWPNDFPEFDKQHIRNFMQELHNLAHQIDPTRLTAIRRCDFCSDIVDVYSPSQWAGWYNGRYTDYKNVTYYHVQQIKRLMHVEWGGDSHAGRFNENPYSTIDSVDVNTPFNPNFKGAKPPYTNKIKVPENGDWSESYICDLFDWTLKEQGSMEWLSGAANWTFKDFSTPLRPENPVPYVNQKGVVQRDLTPKESYYVFQSHWAKEPMVHIFGHGWKVRWGDEKEQKLLKVYSNCQRVELILNGVSLGEKSRDAAAFPASGLWWKSTLKQGMNTLVAVATHGKGKDAVNLTDTLTFEYQSAKWGTQSMIEAKVIERTDAYAWIEAELKDKNGVRCLDSQSYIEFDYTGEGKMIYDLGTPTSSRIVQAYNGRAMIKVELKPEQKGVVSIKSQGVPIAFINL